MDLCLFAENVLSLLLFCSSLPGRPSGFAAELQVLCVSQVVFITGRRLSC